MAHELDGRRVAILVTDGFEQVELTEPKRAPERAGATVHVAWPKDHEVTGWKLTDRDDRFKVDVPRGEGESRRLRLARFAGRADQPGRRPGLQRQAGRGVR